MNDSTEEKAYYEALCNELGAQLVRLRDEQTNALRSARRSRTTTALIRKLYRLDHVSLGTEALARLFLGIIIDTLVVDRAALLEHDPGGGCFRALHVVGFPPPVQTILPGRTFPDGFHFVNSASAVDEFSQELQKLLQAPYLLWTFDSSHGLALLLGNTAEDHHMHPAFAASDREMIESALDVFANVLERKRAEAKLVHDAFHDPLTGLPNRALFIEHLDRAIGRAKRATGYLFSVLFLDLDRFKLVNDSLGHAVGDELLIAFGDRLRAATRPGDVVARLGGDEFAILADDLVELNDAVKLADRIYHELQEPFVLNGQTVFSTASIGIARSAERYQRGDELLRDADIAMYSAKKVGGGHHRLFDQRMRAHTVNRLQMETELRAAIENGELVAYYQPIVDIQNNRLHGFEALMRWKHPERGLVMPMEFINLAEETGLIVAMGQWLAHQVARDHHTWRTESPDTAALTVSINLSDREFLHPQLVAGLARAFEAEGTDTSCLELELTERMLMHYGDLELDTLDRLRDLGIKLVIDDFGTGYSSLSRLQKLPIDRLKIDQSFIKFMDSSRENAEIVRTIITMAHNLGMHVIAEGLESIQHLDRLVALGCEFGQGFLFSRPVPKKQVLELIKRERWLPVL